MKRPLILSKDSPIKLSDIPKMMNGLRIWYLSLNQATKMKVRPPTVWTGTVKRLASTLLNPIARMIWGLPRFSPHLSTRVSGLT